MFDQTAKKNITQTLEAKFKPIMGSDAKAVAQRFLCELVDNSPPTQHLNYGMLNILLASNHQHERALCESVGHEDNNQAKIIH